MPTSDTNNRAARDAGQWESKRFGKYTLWRLDPQGNGEERWSLGVNGPAAYLTCDESVAVWIARAVANKNRPCHVHNFN